MEHSDIFISYRRADVEFAKKFYHKMKETGRNMWVDWENLPPGVEGFSDEIQRGIESSDAFICILSPSYLESEYCLMELREALKLKKRVVPIVLKKFEPMPAPEGIGHINWIYFTPHAGQRNKFEDSFPKVVQALETDYEHTREHTRLLVRAIDWQKNQQGKSYLLKDAEIDKAERWQVAAIGKNPPPNELQGQYILTSRAHQRQQQRRLMAGIGILLALAVFAAIVAGFQWQASVRSEKTAVEAKNDALAQKAIADDQRAIAEAAESMAVAAKEDAVKQKTIAEEQAQNALISGLAAQSKLVQSRQLGILLALESYNASVKKGEIIPAVQTSLRSSLAGFSGIPVQDYPSGAQFTQFSPDNRWLVGASYTERVQISDLSQGSNVKPVVLTDKGSKRKFSADIYTNKPLLAFSADSQWLAGIYLDNDTGESGVWIWSLNDLKSGSRTLALPEIAGSPLTIAFSSSKSKQPWLAVGLDDGSIYTWDVPDLPGAQATLFAKKDKDARAAAGLVFSPDGNWLVAAYQSADPYYTDPNTAGPSMLVWNIKNQVSEPIMIDLFQSPINLLTFSDSGKWLAGSSSSQSNNETKLRLWNMSTLTKTSTSANSFSVDHINDIAFSPDDRWVAIVGGINAEVWSLNNFSSVKLPGYKDSVLTVDFSPDGQWLATGDFDGLIRSWKTAELADKDTPLVESQARTFNSFDVIVNSLDFNSDGSQLAAAGDQQVRLWNLPVPLSAPIKSPYVGDYFTFGNFILVQDSPNSVYVMELSGDEPAVVIETIQDEPLWYFTSPNERYLAIACEQQLQVWDMQNPAKPLFEKKLDNGSFVSPSFTADNRWLVYAVYNQIFAVDLQNPGTPVTLSGNRAGSPISTFYGIDHWLLSQSSSELLAWDTASGLSEPVKLPTLASSASAQFGGDDSKWLFIPQDETLNVLNISDLSAEPLVFEGALIQPIQDRWLLTSTLENEVSLWDISKPASSIVQTLDYGISESQNWFYYFDDEYTLWLLDLKSANPKPMKVRQYEGEYYYYPTISADDHWLAIASDDGTSTLVYDLTQNLAKSELPDVTPFNFSPDGHWLALQDAKQNMVIYDLQAHKQLPVTYPNSYGFQETSPNGRWAVGELDSSANAGMLLIDLSNPEKFYVLTGHTDQVNGRLFTPDQHWLLTYSWDGTVRIWNLEDPADDPVILSHENLVSNAQLLKNGKWLVSATGENVYIWQWDFNAVHDLACRLVGRNLTPIEWDKYIGGEYQKTCEQWP